MKIHTLASIFQDMDFELRFSGYCYYCEICEEILVLSKNLIELGRLRRAFHDRCPKCSWGLELSLRCTRIKVPSQSIFHIHSACRDFFSIKSPVRLQVQCMNLLEDHLDSLLGRLVVLHGDYSAHELSEFICVKAQMPNSYGGLNSQVIFIDGGNLFDPYLISRYADRYQIRRETILNGTQIGRAFTCYQLTSLITKTLPDALEHYEAKLAVIADITRLYTDSDIDEHEAFEAFNQASVFLARLVEKKNLIVLATCVTTSKHGWFESTLFSRAHIIFQIHGNSKPTLEKRSF
jgi:hypothetical protein